MVLSVMPSGSPLSACWTSKPRCTLRTSNSAPSYGCGICNRRQFLRFSSKVPSAVGEKLGAAMASINNELSALTNASSTIRLTAITPPNAETGSDASALGKASAIESAVAMPVGVRCLTMTTVGVVKLLTARHAASTSRMLLYDNSLPPICVAPNAPSVA